MAKILLLVHRLPFPPNKGDKVRSYHLLEYLAARHSVFLGTFIDDPQDEQHVERVRAMCTEAYVARIRPRRARLSSLTSLLKGEPLTLGYYRNTGLSRWVDRTIDTVSIDTAIVFSSAMAQYVDAHRQMATLVDFVDVDSQKWREYAPAHRWPLSMLYRREAKLLLAYERQVAARAKRSYFVTDKESELFRSLAPEVASGVGTMGNGVDGQYFAPDATRVSPFSENEIPLVFTGAMDYWPNVDAVTWFAAEVLPKLRARRPSLRFHIVGRSPVAAVQELASESVRVSGTVPDVRPYLQHAAVVVAPLRLARGVQNKILEAMAMARPVVTSAPCAAALDARVAACLRTAGSAEEYDAQIERLLGAPEQATASGLSGRAQVLEHYGWEAHLSEIDRQLSRPGIARVRDSISVAYG